MSIFHALRMIRTCMNIWLGCLWLEQEFILLLVILYELDMLLLVFYKYMRKLRCLETVIYVLINWITGLWSEKHKTKNSTILKSRYTIVYNIRHIYVSLGQIRKFHFSCAHLKERHTRLCDMRHTPMYDFPNIDVILNLVNKRVHLS